MARKKAKTTKKKAKRTRSKNARLAELIISKSRTKSAVKRCNVSSDFYPALDQFVRSAIKEAEGRATANGRKTLRPQDL
ncbi:MAG: DUF1931 domain-containing protein [Planctomycetota bacterium]